MYLSCCTITNDKRSKKSKRRKIFHADCNICVISLCLIWARFQISFARSQVLLSLCSLFTQVAFVELCFANVTYIGLLKTTFCLKIQCVFACSACAAVKRNKGAPGQSWWSSVINFTREKIRACFKQLVLLFTASRVGVLQNPEIVSAINLCHSLQTLVLYAQSTVWPSVLSSPEILRICGSWDPEIDV